MPTKIELNGLANSGTEDVRTGEVRAFTGIQVSYYWSSTTFASNPSYAWDVTLFDGDVSDDSKALNYYVWPVRGGQ
ncbi:MAG: DUF1566 domain-containing protein [Chloroflexi bacterium]|nr:DUF1566 domain-containing protein [Chloroflexota bacterium]